MLQRYVLYPGCCEVVNYTLGKLFFNLGQNTTKEIDFKMATILPRLNTTSQSNLIPNTKFSAEENEL